MKNATVYNFMLFSPNQMAKVCRKNNSMRQLIFLPSGGLCWSVAMKAISMLMMTEAFMIQSQTSLKKQEDPSITATSIFPFQRKWN